MHRPNPPHWTLNSCFGVFRSVWVHLGSFRYCMKLGAKWAELVKLMQKFVPGSRVRIFLDQRTLSTTLDRKLIFWCVCLCFGAFGIISLLHETWCKTGWTGAIIAKVRATKSCHNCSQRMLTIHTIGPKTHVFVRFFHLGAFGTILLLHETCRKTRQTGTINTKVRATMSRYNSSHQTLLIHTIGT